MGSKSKPANIKIMRKLHKMEDGRLVDTSKAKKHWSEDTRWNGSNHVSLNTDSQWEHETLYLSAKGNYYLELTSDWQGSSPVYVWVTKEKAAKWLLLNNHELPEDLEEHACIVE